MELLEIPRFYTQESVIGSCIMFDLVCRNILFIKMEAVWPRWKNKNDVRCSVSSYFKKSSSFDFFN